MRPRGSSSACDAQRVELGRRCRGRARARRRGRAPRREASPRARPRRAGVQRLAGEDLEQDRAERVDVGAPRRASARRALLGRHVAGRAEHAAGRSVATRAVVAARGRRRAVGAADDARDAPVEHVDLAESPSMMFAGLRSRWIDAARVRELDREAHVDERAQQAARAWTRRDRAADRRASCPASRFIVKYGRPASSTPTS